MTNCGLILGGGRRFFCSTKYPYWCGGQIYPAIDWVLGIKQLVWSEAYHLPPFNAEVKKV
jgi:hypothetical protein